MSATLHSSFAAARLCLLSMLAMLLAFSSEATAQTSPTPGTIVTSSGNDFASRAERQAQALKGDLEGLRREISLPTTTPQNLESLRRSLEQVREAALSASAALAQPLSEISQQLSSIGSADGATEPAAITERRQQLTAQLERLKAARKQLDVIAVEAEQLASRTAAEERQRFLRGMLEQSRSVFDPRLWMDATAAIPALPARLGLIFTAWASAALEATGPVGFALLLAGSLLIIAVAIAGAWRVSQPFRKTPPDDLRRIRRTLRTWFFAILATLFAITAIAALFDITGAATQRMTLVFRAAASGILSLAAMGALWTSILRPRHPEWRLVALSEAQATRLTHLFVAAVAFFGFDQFFTGIAAALFLPAELLTGWNALLCMALTAILVVMLVRVRSADDTVDPSVRERHYFGWAPALTPLLWPVAIVSSAALAAGYISAAKYLTTHILSTAAMIAVLLLMRHLASTFVATGLGREKRFGRFLRRVLRLGDRGVTGIGILFSASVDIALLLLGIPLVLAHWALTWIDFRSWFTSAFFGFRLGDVTIEPAAVLLAIALFGVGLAAARLFGQWLDQRILEPSGVDAGIRNSVRTGAGYLVAVVALLFAFAVAGINMSNIAIVAGALGVGIGLGLQSIVNNFVSGLILLAERSIKVGDWIKTGAGEGIVTRISVRSTEIQTFDLGTIVVPNSNLVADPVLNLTRRGLIGRVTVAVRVSYDSDPETVRDILLSCATSHPLVVKYPQPAVSLDNLGESSLDFKVAAFINDITSGGATGSDLRFAILKAFREAGIEIPFPQRDVRVHAMTWPTGGGGDK